jgi:hypothetical protein
VLLRGCGANARGVACEGAILAAKSRRAGHHAPMSLTPFTSSVMGRAIVESLAARTVVQSVNCKSLRLSSRRFDVARKLWEFANSLLI